MEKTQKMPLLGGTDQCLIVLGMYRSGNSLIGGCLYHAGINLGAGLSIRNGLNGAYTFENQDIKLAHDLLYRDLGIRWDMVGTLPDGWQESKAAERAYDKITQIIEQQFLRGGLWAINDPRVSRITPIWLKALAKYNIIPSFIHIVRHPYEVASSMNRHHQTELLKGHLLWLVYNREALRNSRSHYNTLLTFDQILADPISSLNRISTELECELPGTFHDNPQILNEFIRPEYKHHHLNQSLRLSSNGAFEPYAWAYEQIRLNQIKAISPHDGHKKILKKESITDLPIVVNSDANNEVQTARDHATEMFNNLLGLIGQYEQAEIDHKIQLQRRLLSAKNLSETLFIQAYFPTMNGEICEYPEDQSKKILLAPNEWQFISYEINRPEDLRSARLRVDPLNTHGIVAISSIKLTHAVTNEILWSAEASPEFNLCQVEGTGFILSSNKSLIIVCTGNKLHLFVPKIPDLPDCPIQLTIWIKVSKDQDDLIKTWNLLCSEKNQLEQDIKTFQSDKVKLEDRIAQYQNKIDSLYISKTESERTHEELGQKLSIAIKEIEQSKVDAESKIQKLNSAIQKMNSEFYAKEQDYLNQQSQNHEKINQLEKLIDDKSTKIEKLKTNIELSQNKIDDYKDLIEDEQHKKSEISIQYDESQSQLKKSQLIINSLESEIIHLKEKVSRQEELCHQYYDEIVKTEQESQNNLSEVNRLNNSLRQKNEKIESLNHAISQLHSYMADLNHAFKALIASKRYRLGNMIGRFFEFLRFRSKSFTAVAQIEGIFAQYNKSGKSQKCLDSNNSMLSFRTRPANSYEGVLLISWMIQLERDFRSFLDTRRWKTGNSIIRKLEILRFKRKVYLAVDHMSAILNDFKKWYDSGLSDRSGSSLTYKEIEKLKDWMSHLEHDFQATLKSRRWRLGCFMAKIYERFTNRKTRVIVSDCMQDIFNDYHSQF